MGFPISRFRNGVDPWMICLLCNNVLQHPKMVDIAGCQHMFCHACLIEAFTHELFIICPSDGQSFPMASVRDLNRFSRLQYNKFSIECQFLKCGQSLPIEDIEKHENVCKYNPKHLISCSKCKFAFC